MSATRRSTRLRFRGHEEFQNRWLKKIMKSFTPPTTGKIFVVGWMGAVVLVVGLTAGLVLARDLWIGQAELPIWSANMSKVSGFLVTKVIHSPRSRQLKTSRDHPWLRRNAGLSEGRRLSENHQGGQGRSRQAGQVLAVLDSPELDHQVENARATYQLDKITDDRNQMLAADRRGRPADCRRFAWRDVGGDGGSQPAHRDASL